ncbi:MULTISPECIES: 2OG-Fe(II) oxygenase [unclassified Moraxella]|uniref:2OG-Fe(II) oxygenase n=1 Tax=unclassified Moraxella TaxID=2685852 RepID=UPI003AF4AF2D
MELEKLSVMQYLDKSWQEWLINNYNAGIHPRRLAQSMLEKGLVDAMYAMLSDFDLTLDMPMIDLSSNQIELSDKTVSLTFVCQKPYVVVIDDFLSAEECQQMLQVSNDKFNPARVVDKDTGEFVEHYARTSMNTGFVRGEFEIIKVIESRISSLLHWPVENGEGIQVLRYQDGGEYKAHFDFFNKNEKGSAKQMEHGGQRVGTFLMYLSDVERGGATRFPTMNFEVRPKAGMALYFANTLLTGQTDDLTFHASVPVVQGTKYIATKWLRQSAY